MASSDPEAWIGALCEMIVSGRHLSSETAVEPCIAQFCADTTHALVIETLLETKDAPKNQVVVLTDDSGHRIDVDQAHGRRIALEQWIVQSGVEKQESAQPASIMADIESLLNSKKLVEQVSSPLSVVCRTQIVGTSGIQVIESPDWVSQCTTKVAKLSDSGDSLTKALLGPSFIGLTQQLTEGETNITSKTFPSVRVGPHILSLTATYRPVVSAFADDRTSLLELDQDFKPTVGKYQARNSPHLGSVGSAGSAGGYLRTTLSRHSDSSASSKHSGLSGEAAQPVSPNLAIPSPALPAAFELRKQSPGNPHAGPFPMASTSPGSNSLGAARSPSSLGAAPVSSLTASFQRPSSLSINVPSGTSPAFIPQQHAQLPALLSRGGTKVDNPDVDNLLSLIGEARASLESSTGDELLQPSLPQTKAEVEARIDELCHSVNAGPSTMERPQEAASVISQSPASSAPQEDRRLVFSRGRVSTDAAILNRALGLETQAKPIVSASPASSRYRASPGSASSSLSTSASSRVTGIPTSQGAPRARMSRNMSYNRPPSIPDDVHERSEHEDSFSKAEDSAGSIRNYQEEPIGHMEL